MSRAKNDRNTVRFGPAPASVESEVRKLRREQQQAEFRLTEGGLLLPDVTAPGVVAPPPPVVVPGDLNVNLTLGSPFILNDLSGVFAAYNNEVHAPRVSSVASSAQNLSGFDVYVTGNTGTVHFLEPPSATAVSILSVPNLGNMLAGGGRHAIVVSNLIIGNNVIYDSDTGTYQSIEALMPNEEELTPIFNQILAQNNVQGTVVEGSFEFQTTTTARLSSSTFIVNQTVNVSRSFTDSGGILRQVRSAFEVFCTFDFNLSRSALLVQLVRADRSISAFGSTFRESVSSLGQSYFYLRGTSGGWSPDSFTRILEATSTSFKVVTSSDRALAPEFPTQRQVKRSFVDSSGRLVYMSFSPSLGLWQINRLNTAGARSVLPLVFSGNPLDQPIFVEPFGSAGYPVSNSTSPQFQPGVAAGPNNGYFIYGAIAQDFGQINRDGTPLLTAVPAIWFTDGFTTQRIWTLPDSEEFPLDLLSSRLSSTFNTHSSSSISTINTTSINISIARLNCGVSNLHYDPATRRISFLVRRGASFIERGTGFEGTDRHFGSQSLLYRVQL